MDRNTAEPRLRARTRPRGGLAEAPARRTRRFVVSATSPRTKQGERNFRASAAHPLELVLRREGRVSCGFGFARSRGKIFDAPQNLHDAVCVFYHAPNRKCGDASEYLQHPSTLNDGSAAFCYAARHKFYAAIAPGDDAAIFFHGRKKFTMPRFFMRRCAAMVRRRARPI